jgi:integrase
MWHVRFYADVPDRQKRQRKSVPVGPAVGKERLTKSEAKRKAGEILRGAGVNTAEHLERAIHPQRIKTFADRVEWCRQNHKAWTDGKPGPVATMEGHLTKHILPRFGALAVESIDETTVQEFVADLKRSTFDRRKPDGTLIKTYRLSRKTILNVVGVVKLVLGRKVWMSWELDLGKPSRPRQRYFTQEQLKQIIQAAPGPYRVLFALLASTGMRIGEAAGLHLDDLDLENGVVSVRRSVWNGQELEPKPKTPSARSTSTRRWSHSCASTSERPGGCGCSKRATARRCPPATSAIACFNRSWPSSGFRRPVCTPFGIPA